LRRRGDWRIGRGYVDVFDGCQLWIDFELNSQVATGQGLAASANFSGKISPQPIARKRARRNDREAEFVQSKLGGRPKPEVKALTANNFSQPRTQIRRKLKIVRDHFLCAPSARTPTAEAMPS
jgi:hypothetical protein